MGAPEHAARCALRKRSVYSELVESGYAFGLAGFPFPADEPIGSAWAHGFRLGRSDANSTVTNLRAGFLSKRLGVLNHDQSDGEGSERT
jgi:hypothetical protein